MSLVILKPKSHQTKASLKASAAWHEKPKRQPKPITVTLTTKADFAAWTAQNPATGKAFGIMLRRWMGSNTVVRGVSGYWAAWSYPEWSKWTGMPVATLKRHFDRIEEAGLMERRLHRHGGTKVLAHIRPTPLALVVAGVHHSDWKHLGLAAPFSADQIKPMEMMEATLAAAYLAFIGSPLVAISKQERAAMKSIINEVPQLATSIVDTAVRNWVDFSIYVAQATGYPGTPNQPSVAYIRKHLQAAADFTAKHQIKKNKRSAPKPCPLSPAEVSTLPDSDPMPTLADILAPVDPEDLPMTKEEFFAALAAAP